VRPSRNVFDAAEAACADVIRLGATWESVLPAADFDVALVLVLDIVADADFAAGAVVTFADIGLVAAVDCARAAKLPLGTEPLLAFAVAAWIRADASGVIGVFDGDFEVDFVDMSFSLFEWLTERTRTRSLSDCVFEKLI
jgi:hypothetical protein